MRTETHTWIDGVPMCPACLGVNQRIHSVTKDQVTGRCKCGCEWSAYNMYYASSKKDLENNVTKAVAFWEGK